MSSIIFPTLTTFTVILNWQIVASFWEKMKHFHYYYIHFEITGDPCNLIGSQQCDLFTNRTIFCSKSHLSPSQ